MPVFATERSWRLADHFAVENNFYGGQVGVNSRWCGLYGFSFDGTFKFAMGSMNEKAEISGSNTLAFPGVPATTQATGLYAQPSNIGDHTRDKFAVIPEFIFNINYNVTQNVAVFVGWDFLYASNVARAAAIINPTVNDSNVRYIASPTIGNASGPTFSFKDQNYWMQGINFGVRLEF